MSSSDRAATRAFSSTRAATYPQACLALALLLGALAAPADAADKTPGKEQLRRLQQMQHKLEQENAQLQQEKAAADSELASVRQKADGETRRATLLRREADALKSAKDAIAARLSDTESELQRTQEQLRTSDTERRRLDALAAEQKKALADCAARNEALHQQGVDLLERYEKKSCLDSALQGEPFTGLKRVEIENFIEDNRAQLDEKKLRR